MSEYIMRHEYEDDEDVLTVVGELVRCKDCRWKEECVITELWGGGNGYCRSGERKDDE